MKRSLIFFVVSLFFISTSCKKINEGCTDSSSLNYNSNVEQDDGSCIYPAFEKKALVFESTGQNCGYCGDWGATYSTDLQNSYPDLEIIELHVGDNFQSALVRDLIKNLGYSGTPHFFVGTESMDNSYSIISSRVLQEFQKTPDVALIVSHSIDGNRMTIDVQTKKSTNLTGEYYLAVYILEDGQKGYQLVSGGPSIPDFEHNHVMRLEASNEMYGIPINYDGESSLNQFTVILQTESPKTDYILVPENCYPVAVIWKKSGSGFEFVNVRK